MSELPFDPSPLIRQLGWGSAFDGVNCGMAATAQAIARATLGKRPAATASAAPWRPTPVYLRRISGDTSGGTTLSQQARVAFLGYGVDLDVRIGIDFEEAWELLVSGRGMSLSLGYSVIRDTPAYRGSETFGGNHQVFLNHVVRKSGEFAFGFDALTDGRRPGIAKGPLLYPKALLKAAAANLRIGDTARAGDRTYAGFTVDTGSGLVVPAQPVAFRYGGTASWRGKYVVLVPGSGTRARIRRSPYLRADNVVRTVVEGLPLPFVVAQSTLRGSAVGTGRHARLWHGDRTGRLWVHHSVVRHV